MVRAYQRAYRMILRAVAGSDCVRALVRRDRTRGMGGRMETLEARTLLSGNVGFEVGQKVEVRGGSSAVCIGDFNGDGTSDVAVAGGYYGSVSILLGNGDGSFGDPTSYGAGVYPTDIAAADLNGDGKSDLVVTGFYSSVNILLGNGDGSFQNTVGYDAGTSAVTTIAIADFDGDGKSDVAVAGNSQSSVSVLLGTGDGSLGAVTHYNTGLNPESIAAGDFNGDGKVDMAAAGFGSVSVLLNNGDGSFQNARSYNAGTYSTQIAVADFNGDGENDLAVATYYGSVSILLGDGDGSFQGAISQNTGLRPTDLAVADFNGDGENDLAVATFYGSVSVLLGGGNGSLQTGGSYSAGQSVQRIACGDLDHDGMADLAAADYGWNTATILLNTVNVVDIPDEHLQAGIRTVLNKPAGDIKVQDLALLISLDVSSARLRDLTGLGKAANLQSLNMADNQVTDLTPLAGLTGLKQLDVSGNYLDTADDSATMGIIRTLQSHGTSVVYLPVKHAPTAADQSLTIDEDTGLAGSVSATDADNRSLIYSVVTAPQNGLLTLQADGSFVYTPNANYNGSDGFTFRANDGQMDSNVGTVSIGVTSIPDTPADIVLSNTTVAATSQTGIVVSCIRTTDGDPGDSFTYTLVSGDGADNNNCFVIDEDRLKTATGVNCNGSRSYRVRIRTTDPAGLWFEKAFAISVAKYNDKFADALTIGSGDNQQIAVGGTTEGAMVEDGEPDLYGHGGASIWYRWIAPAYGVAAIDAVGDDLITLAMYTGDSLSSLTQEGLNYDYRRCGIVTRVAGGQVYHICISSPGETGSIVLSMDRVAVMDDSAPTDLVISGDAVGKEAAAGSIVGTLSATDSDEGDYFAYSLVDGEGSEDNTLFAITGDRLETASALDAGRTNCSIRVRATDGGGLWFEKTLTIRVNTPANDNLADAQGIDDKTGGGYSLRGSTTGAGWEADELTPWGGDGGASVWYRWLAPATGTVTIDTRGSDFDTLLAVYAVDRDLSWHMLCDANDNTMDGTANSAVTINVTAGSLYAISVDGHWGCTGDFVLNLSAMTISNDSFADAYAISGGIGKVTTVAGTNANTSKEDGEPNHAGDVGGASVWYRWMAPASGLVTIGISDSDFDALLGVYRGSDVSSLAVVAEGTNGDGNDSAASRATLAVSAGSIYMIAIDGYEGAMGDFELSIGLIEANRAPTGLRLSSNDVVADQVAGVYVGGFATTDANADDRFSYWLISGNGSDDNGMFYISGNQLRTSGPLDYDAKSRYSVRVRTMDMGGLYFDQTFTIVPLPAENTFGARHSWSFVDEDGDRVTFRLSGRGEGYLDEERNIILSRTNASTSLSVQVKRGRDGDGMVEIQGIQSDGLLKAISAPGVILEGTMQLDTNYVPAGAHAVSLSLGQVVNGSIQSETLPIRSLTLLDWDSDMRGSSSLSAPWVGTIAVKGRKAGRGLPALAGNLYANVMLSDANRRGCALGRLSVAGDLAGASVQADQGSIGSILVRGWLDGSRVAAGTGIGSVSVGSLLGSDILVGVRTDLDGDFASVASDFANPNARLGSLIVRGGSSPTDAYTSGSQISAGVIGTVRLMNFGLEGDQTQIHTLPGPRNPARVSYIDQADRANSWTWSAARPAAGGDGVVVFVEEDI